MKSLSINPVHIKNATDNFTNAITSGADCHLVTSPFKVFKFNNFLSSEISFIKNLTKDIRSLKFHRKANDLYSLLQTADLSNVEGIESVSTFLEFLRNTVQPFLSKIFAVELNATIASTASLYKLGDYLLCHDDKCENRCIAFVFYLTGTSQKEDGGNFEMFDHDDHGEPTSVSVSIPPEANSFLCFQVGDYTFHQVSQVTGKSFQRLSINGWFHSDTVLQKTNRTKNTHSCSSQLSLHHQTSIEGLLLLDEYLNISYCTPSNILQMRSEFENDSEMALPNFLRKELFEMCLAELKSPSIVWNYVGPANRRRYSIANESTLPETVMHLINLLKSSLFISYFRNLTGLSLEPYSVGGDIRDSSMCLIEVQKLTCGDYMMVTDTDTFFTKSGLDVFLFFNSPKKCKILTGKTQPLAETSGFITYLAKGEDDELLTVEPKDNMLQMIYRTSDTVRFMKYINWQIEEPYFCICITYYEPFKEFPGT